MTNRDCVRRLQREYQKLLQEPPTGFAAHPNQENILEWHYLIEGPEGTPYQGGRYHGKIKFPEQYPHKPPAILMITPSGRFIPETRLCLSYSDFHPESWNPMWNVSTILTGLISFMTSTEEAMGTIVSTDGVKKAYAKASMEYNLKNPVFRKHFEDECQEDKAAPSAPASASATPSSSSGATSSSSAAPTTPSPPLSASVAPTGPTPVLNNAAAAEQQVAPAANARTPSPAAPNKKQKQRDQTICRAIMIMIVVALAAVWLNRYL